MVEFEIKVHPRQKLAYIPKEIVDSLGFVWKANPNTKAMVVYPKDTPLIQVLKSLEIILADLKLRLRWLGETDEKGSLVAAKPVD